MSISIKTMLFSISLIANSTYASELAMQWDWTLSAQTSKQQSTVFNPVIASPTALQSVNGLFDAQLDYQGFSASVALKADNIYHSNNDYEYKTTFILSELFWQGSISNAIDLQIGKVRVDWGVGYGYRPLDIFTPYRRNPVGIQVEEGAGIASLSYFDALGEWTLIYSDSSWNQQLGNQLDEQATQQGIGIRRYGLIDDTEYQFVAYYDDVRHGLIATSLVTVFDEAWEFHGTALYQNKFLGYQQKQYGAVHLEKQNNGYQALAGLTWAHSTGHTIIFEYWYDNRAWNKQQWQQAINDGDQYYQQGYTHSNIVAHNLMLHWAFDNSILKDVVPSMDLLYSPQDNGLIVTQWISYLLHDSGRSKIEIQLAARFFTGKHDAAYANLPDQHTFLANLKGRF
ncbi:hypothetical protein CW745_02620 [Psychromonas sp. psych-6C06]|uniref:hypothetical protein n=1 Tax=Psychromonas sp. psych-6C06 TaxID=2058089 RepID=UPI000C326D43|nr:hypothetical protein [Psychromonas sp. psych-6C06]PKF63752.1 hypothetical protein CW745_02620 [Psychromonas sp. psych-6C06]